MNVWITIYIVSTFVLVMTEHVQAPSMHISSPNLSFHAHTISTESWLWLILDTADPDYSMNIPSATRTIVDSILV